MKQNLIVAMVWLTAVAAFGQLTYTTNVTLSAAIPDNNPSGFAESIAVGGLSGTVSNVTVSVDITGGFNGDLYAYLVGPNGGFAVLLNRSGVGPTSSSGYGDQGFNVTFSDTAANGDIHYYQNTSNPMGGQLTGTWQPDGEAVDPQQSASLFPGPSGFPAAQTAMLSSFEMTDPNGTWTLFIADLSPGGVSTLTDVGLTIMTVPEPSPLVLALLGGTATLMIWGRRRVNKF
jgi:subtilisin-like proprotein convertase family protein